ncbi:MAG TPA: hypothetical protein VFS24_19650 [Steroidobacteraceae bacterium]|nr:hypothetical protein [Steroidobacteraceae bacterium]
MSAVSAVAYTDNAFVRIDALAFESLTPEFFAMYEKYRDALKAGNVDGALIVTTLASFLFETSFQPSDRWLH